MVRDERHELIDDAVHVGADVAAGPLGSIRAVPMGALARREGQVALGAEGARGIDADDDEGGELALVDQGGSTVPGVPADALFQRGKEC